MAGLLVGAAIIPDAAFFWLLLPHRLWWVAALLDITDIWAFLWLLGIYGTMVKRPHELSPTKVILYNGILQCVEFSPEDIKDVKTIGLVRKRKLPRSRDDGSTVLTFGGVQLICIDLHRPGVEYHLFSSKPRKVSRIYVASDAPDALRDDLWHLIRVAPTTELRPA